jgi:hypothetical protein
MAPRPPFAGTPPAAVERRRGCEPNLRGTLYSGSRGVGHTASADTGIALEQVQFSTIRGAALASQGTALTLENGYIFANTIQGMDLEESRVCLKYASATAMSNAFVAPT